MVLLLGGRIGSRNADLENDGGGGNVIWFIAKKHLLLYFINAQSDLPSKIGVMHGFTWRQPVFLIYVIDCSPSEGTTWGLFKDYHSESEFQSPEVFFDHGVTAELNEHGPFAK